MKAPGCRKPVKFESILSGNTYGTKVWTDGKREAPMLPDFPLLRISRTQGVMFWTEECEEIGRIGTGLSSGSREKWSWKSLDYAEEPSTDDYFAALESGIATTPEQVRYVRRRICWQGNDPIRRGESRDVSERYLANLRELSGLLSEEDENDRLMKAEICRELQLFDEALNLLREDFSEKVRRAAYRILFLTATKDHRVALISIL